MPSSRINQEGQLVMSSHQDMIKRILEAARIPFQTTLEVTSSKEVIVVDEANVRSALKAMFNNGSDSLINYLDYDLTLLVQGKLCRQLV